MELRETFRLARGNLLANRSRTVLTMLGIIIGIASVIVIMAVGEGMQHLVVSQITKVGSDLVAVLPGGSDEEGPPASAFGVTITTLKNSDIEELVKPVNVPHAEAVSGYVRGVGTVTAAGESLEYSFLGVSASYLRVEKARVEQGRFFTAQEEEGVARVAVLGSQVKTDLFGGDDALNKKIKIKGETFRIIGVMEERGVVALENFDDIVIIPLRTAQKLLLGIDYLGFMRLKVDDVRYIDVTTTDVKRTLRQAHNIDDASQDDFTVRDTKQALDILNSVTGALSVFLAAIASISLLVGGVGIMNTMLVAVTERTKEVGLRKALGATTGEIMRQFMLETVAISLIGAALGVAAGVIIAGLIALAVGLVGYDWVFRVPMMAFLVSAVIAVAIGFVFGLYPARRAAKMNPISALGYE